MRIGVLNGLRGFAAIFVVLSHLPQISNTQLGYSLYILIQNLHLGYLGVDLFFVLSGFLITRILIRDKAAGTFSFKLFYLKRVLRIFPIYFLTILVCGILFSWDGMWHLSTYVANYYFAFNGSGHPLEHTWSLSIEEHYYLIWPFLIYYFPLKAIRNYSWLVVTCLVLFSLLLVYNVFDEPVSRRLIYMGTEFRIISLCFGSTLAFYEQRIMGWNKTKATRWLLVLSAIFFILVLLVFEGILDIIIPDTVARLFLFSCCSVCIFVMVLIQEQRKNTLDTLFGNKFIGQLGKISYGLYLYHFPIFFKFGITKNQLDGAFIPFLDFLLPIFATLLIAIFSYKFIEEPILKHKARLTLKFK